MEGTINSSMAICQELPFKNTARSYPSSMQRSPLFVYTEARFSPAYKVLTKEQQKSHLLLLQLWCLESTLFSPPVYLCSPQQMSQESFTTWCSLSVTQILCVVEEACGRHWVHQVLSSIQPLTALHCICWGTFSKTLASQQQDVRGKNY